MEGVYKKDMEPKGLEEEDVQDRRRWIKAI